MAAASQSNAPATSHIASLPHPHLTIPRASTFESSFNDARSPGEALNRNRQNLFARQLKNFVKARTRRVAVLLLSWTEKDIGSLGVTEEIRDLKDVLEYKYHFKVYGEELDSNKLELPHYQLQAILSEFFAKHDKPGTLCIVYYGGHASRDKRGEELILRRSHIRRNAPEKESIYWNRIEPSLQRLNADLLLILDCCYAGILEHSTRQWISRGHFEFIGSTSWDATARGPESPGSFSRHLIKALDHFAADTTIPFFTTSSLVQKIKSYKHFRDHAKGSVCLSTCGKVNIFRNLNIMPLKPGLMNAPSPDGNPAAPPLNFYLHLKYVFTKEPSEFDIMTLVERLSELIKNDGLPVSNVLWEGLSKYNPRMHMADAAERLLATFSRRSSLASLRRFNSSDGDAPPPRRKLSRSLTTLSNEIATMSEPDSPQAFNFEPILKKLHRSVTRLSTEEGVMMSKTILPSSKQSTIESDSEMNSSTNIGHLRRVPTVQFSSRRVRSLQLRFIYFLAFMGVIACLFIIDAYFAGQLFLPLRSNFSDLLQCTNHLPLRIRPQNSYLSADHLQQKFNSLWEKSCNSVCSTR